MARFSKRVRNATILVVCVVLFAACAGDGGTDDTAAPDGTDAPTGTEAPTTSQAEEDPDGAEATSVTVQYSWIPDCQFAGYLVAEDQGLYEAEGIDYTGLPGGPNVNPVQQVVTGAADFTINKVAALFAARDQGLPLKAVAQYDQTSSFPLVAFADTGIEEPEDLADQEVGIWYDGDEFEIFALLEQAGLDPEEDLTLFEQGFTMEPFLNGEYDVAMVTSFNELHVLHLEGIAEDELNVINPSDYGISIPHGTLIVNEEWLEDNSDAAARFVRATTAGWQYAFENPEETAELCAETSLATGGEAATEELQELQTRMIASMEALHFPEGSSSDQHGQIDPELYQNVADIAAEFGLVEEAPNVAESIDTSVWDEAIGS